MMYSLLGLVSSFENNWGGGGGGRGRLAQPPSLILQKCVYFQSLQESMSPTPKIFANLVPLTFGACCA